MLSPLESIIPSWDSPTLQGFDTSNIDVENSQRIGGSNKRQYVRFYKRLVPEVRNLKAKLNDDGTVKAKGTEVVQVEKLFVNIVTPGDKNTYDDIATEWHKREFYQHYKSFQDGRTVPLGKDLDECEYVSPSIVMELKYRNCHTEEQLADASDIMVEGIADGWQLREMARAMCIHSRNTASEGRVKALSVELDTAKSQMLFMQQQMEEMRTMLVNSRGELISTIQPQAPAARKSRTKNKEKAATSDAEVSE